jgi:hypothetical protein
MSESTLDAQVVERFGHFVERLEKLLPPTHGVMAWAYNREGADLDLTVFRSHESTGETLRILQVIMQRLLEREANTGANKPRDYEPVSAPYNQQLVSSAQVTKLGAHDHVRLWIRGGLAGELVVPEGDGHELLSRLYLAPRSEDPNA